MSTARAHHLAATVGGRDLGLLRGQRGHVEELRDALTALDLYEQHASAARGERQRQGGGDGRLAGAAFARDEVQAGLRRGSGQLVLSCILGCNHTASL